MKAQPKPEAGQCSRRTALKATAVGLAGAGLGAGTVALATRLGNAPRPAYRFFNEAEAALVIELCEQFIPRDDVPGASDAGVIHFIDRQLMGPYKRHKETYRNGLAAFAQTCLKLHQKPFAQLSAETKIAVMKLVEAGKAPADLWKGVGQGTFFKLILEHTMQGFYGSPRHGGNRDYVSFRMMGVPYPQVIGQNRYGRKAR